MLTIRRFTTTCYSQILQTHEINAECTCQELAMTSSRVDTPLMVGGTSTSSWGMDFPEKYEEYYYVL